MAMNPMQKKARTSFLLGMFLTLIITGLIIVFLILQLGKLNQEIESIQYRKVYVLSKDAKSGEKIEGLGELKEVDSSSVPSNAISGANIGDYITENTTLKIAANAGTVVTTDMVIAEGGEVSPDTRVQEYNMVILPSQLEDGEYVDVRLRLPSGEDYIVLSKKYVMQSDANTMWVQVSEDEILTMSNAIVESYIMEGSFLYATTYSDAGMQNASTPTYIASQGVINLMNSDPNITTTAKNALAARYTEAARNQRTSINSALEGYADTSLQNIETDVAEEIEKQKTARQQYVDGLSQ